MGGAPIIVHPPGPGGGRRVVARGQYLGLAHSDQDVIELLRVAGLPDGERLLDDEAWVYWRGGRAHEYDAF